MQFFQKEKIWQFFFKKSFLFLKRLSLKVKIRLIPNKNPPLIDGGHIKKIYKKTIKRIGGTYQILIWDQPLNL